MTEEEKALEYLTTRPGWDLLKQIVAEETRQRMNSLSDRSKQRREKDPDDALWGEVRGMNRLVRVVEQKVEIGRERDAEEKRLGESDI